jgi:hypothetical protein
LSHGTAHGTLQNAADNLAQDLAAPAKRASRIVITLLARTIAGSFKLAAAARHLAHFGTYPSNLAVDLLQGLACSRYRCDCLVIGLSRGADRLLV